MIISNTSANPEINRRAISTLGDTLSGRGDNYAAHFCYILSQVDFGAYGESNVKLVLIGANHHKPYPEFISTDAIMLTEIYEYARKLSEPFTLIELQTFKFNIAVKMVDYGLVEKALLYIEQVATNIAVEPEKYKQSFINDVYVLGDRLKYHDPVCKDSYEDAANLSWLNKLAEIVGKCATGEIVQENNLYATNALAQETVETTEYQQPNVYADYAVDPNVNVPTMEADSHAEWQNNLQVANVPHSYGVNADAQYNDESANDVQQHYQNYQDYWAQQQQQQQLQSYDQQDYVQQGGLQYGSEQQPEAEHIEHQNNWGYEVG